MPKVQTYQAKIWRKANNRYKNWPYTMEWLTLHYGCYHYAAVTMKEENDRNGIVSIYGVVETILNYQFTVRRFAIVLFWMTIVAAIIWYFTFGSSNYWIYSECMDVPTHRHCWKSFCDDNDCSGYDRDNPPPSARWIP
jgi:hypothetical protein